MDLLSQHEAFLRAIYDTPEDNTARLVYADFLQEQGEEDRAQFIRWQCGRGEKPERLPQYWENYVRGFQEARSQSLMLKPEELLDAEAMENYRRNMVRWSPQVFSAPSVLLSGGRITSAEPFDVLFGLAMCAQVTELELVGEEVSDENDGDSEFKTYHLEPVITTTGVVALAQHRGLRRIKRLDLRNNDLDNDAARALVKSPYLGNLKRLQLLEGNRFRGKVWQQVIERFGEDVVG